MKKILSILALLAAFMFVGSVAHASPALPTCGELGTASGWCTDEDGNEVMSGGTTTGPTDQEACEYAGHIWAGDFCYDRIAYNPESQVPVTPEPGPAECVGVCGPAVAVEPVPVPEPSTVPVRSELAYTGVGDFVLPTAGLVIGLAGVAMVRYSLRMKREANG